MGKCTNNSKDGVKHYDIDNWYRLTNLGVHEQFHKSTQISATVLGQVLEGMMADFELQGQVHT